MLFFYFFKDLSKTFSQFVSFQRLSKKTWKIFFKFQRFSKTFKDRTNLNVETFPQDLYVIRKRLHQNYYKILKKCFLGTTWTVILSTDSNIQSCTVVLPVAKKVDAVKHVLVKI